VSAFEYWTVVLCRTANIMSGVSHRFSDKKIHGYQFFQHTNNMPSNERSLRASRRSNYAVRGSRGRRPSALRRLVTRAMKFIGLKCDESRDEGSSPVCPSYSAFPKDDIQCQGFDTCFESVPRPRGRQGSWSTPEGNFFFYNSPTNNAVTTTVTYGRQVGLFRSDRRRTVTTVRHSNTYHRDHCAR
jgi:hypothetical protein